MISPPKTVMQVPMVNTTPKGERGERERERERERDRENRGKEGEREMLPAY